MDTEQLGTLIIKLNRNLEVFSYQNRELKSIFDSKTNSKADEKIILELFKKFQEIWSDTIWPHLNNHQNLAIIFILGQKAGFTDARVISIWLNSLALFETEKNIRLAKYLDFQDDVDSRDYLDQNLNQIQTQINWSSHLDAAIYTREPSIGKH